MKRASAILLVWLGIAVASFANRSYIASLLNVSSSAEFDRAIGCVLASLLGTIVYCIRGLYMTGAVRGEWNDSWLPWYFWRPFAGLIVGVAVWFIMRAGVVAVTGTTVEAGNQFLYYAFAFLAGLNVKNALAMIERTGEKQWGITPTREARGLNDPPDGSHND